MPFLKPAATLALGDGSFAVIDDRRFKGEFKTRWTNAEPSQVSID